MLTKLLDGNSFFKTEDIQVTLIEPGSIDFLVKKAAHSEVESFVSQLKPEDGKAYLHINAMGAGEYYGPNKNGDYFPEAQLIKYFKTFEDTGYVYRHHINKDPAKSMGRVIFAIYNYDMHRVELVVAVDKVKARDILERIEMGDFPMTSMACKTPFDVCSICSNKASTRAQYCTHLKNELLQIQPDGKQVMSMNVGPLRFFDISIVIRPADVTSSVLSKVASADGEQTDSATVGSAEMAAREGIDGEREEESVKSAAIRKMSELVKEVQGGEVTKVSPVMESIIAQTQDLPVESAKELLGLGSYNQVLNGLAEAGINPSSQFYMALLHHNGLKTRWEDGDFAQAHPDVSYEDVPASVKSYLTKFRGQSALDQGSVEKRAYYWEQAVGAPKELHATTVAAMPKSTPKPDNIAATAAGAMILNHYINKNPETKALIDKILSIFFGAALISKLSVSELGRTHAMLNSSNGMNKQANTVDNSHLACIIAESCVLTELLSLSR